MYRTPDETPRCPCCHSLELSEITKFDPSEGYAMVHFELKEPPKGMFASNRLRLAIDRARICLACGHVMLSLSEKRRAELVERIGELAAIPPEA